MFKTASTTVTYVIHYLTLHYGSIFQKYLAAFGGDLAQKHLEAAKNFTFSCYENIVHLKTRELHFRHEAKLIYN